MSRKPLSGVDTARVLWLRFEIERARQLSDTLRELSPDEVEAAAMAEAQDSEPAQAEPATPEADPVRTRRDCLRDAMESAFDALEAELGRHPNDYDMWGYLTKRDTSGYVTGSSDNLIYWLDWAGSKKTANKRNISDRLANIIKSRNG